MPYGLTWEDFQGIVPGIEKREGTEIQLFSSYDKQGLNGGANTCILTLNNPSLDNTSLSKTVFVKKSMDPMKMEAQKYEALVSLGIPTPSLLRRIRRNSGEIIILEFLPKIGIDFQSNAEVYSLLHLIAQVNSIQDPPECFNPPSGEIPQMEFDERVRIALLDIVQDPSMQAEVNIARWLDAYRSAQTTCTVMPMAVNHNEFYFQQVGWTSRDGIDQLVIFDLETMWLSPRFTDIAGILHPLAMYVGQRPFELFEIYFHRLCELSHPELGIDEAFHEMRLVHIRDTFCSLPWLVDVAKGSDINLMLDYPLAFAVNGLYDSLTALGFL